MTNILVVKPDEQLTLSVTEAAKKFSGVFNVPLSTTTTATSREAIRTLETSLTEVVIFSHGVQAEDINSVFSQIVTMHKKPISVVPSALYHLVSRESKVLASHETKNTKEYWYGVLRLLLVRTDRKLDVRVIRSVLMAACEVVKTNTDEDLVISKPSTDRNQMPTRDMSLVVTLLGDGLKGCVSVSSSRKMITTFLTKMLGSDMAEIDNDVLCDFLGELGNQIVGVIRKQLVKFGYDELESSMFFVASGDQHEFLDLIAGNSFHMPMSHTDGQFGLTFDYDWCRVDLAKINIDQLAIKRDKGSSKSKILDIRLVNMLLELLTTELGKALSTEVTLLSTEIHQSIPYSSNYISLVQGGGRQGDYVLLFEFGQGFCRKIAPESEASEGSKNALLKKNVAKIFGDIQNKWHEKAATKGYQFEKLFHGFFSFKEIGSYLFKNQGCYAKFLFQFDQEHFRLCFGIDSEFAHQSYDLFDYLAQHKGPVLRNNEMGISLAPA